MQNKLSGFTITLIYFIVAGLWIAFTDQAVEFFFPDPNTISQIQTYKGLFYVIITSLGLYLLIRKHDEQLLIKEQKLKNQVEEHRSQRELLEKLFERIPVMINSYNPNLDEFDINKKFEHVVGWNQDEVKGFNLTKACFPDPELRQKVKDFMATPNQGWREFPMMTKSGEKIHTLWTNIHLSDNTLVGIGMDITRRKEYEEQIKESQRLLRKTFESLHSAVCIVDPETRTFIDCNQRTEELFGYSREEIIGESTRIIHVNEKKFQEFDKIGFEKLEKNGVFNTEFKLRKKNGDIFYSDHTVTLVYDDEGEVERVVSVIRDITEKKEYEAKLKQSRERLARAQKIGKMGDWGYDPESGNIYWSSTLYKIFDRNPEKGPPSFDEVLQTYYKENSEPLTKYVEQAIKKGEAYDDDMKVKTETGEQKYVRTIGIPITNDTGEVERLLGIVQDITDRKLAELQLNESEKKYRLLFQYNPQPMWIFDPKTLEFVEVNKAAIRHYGYTEKEFLSMTIADIRPQKYVSDVQQALTDVTGGAFYGDEWIHQKKDGTTIFVRITAEEIQLQGNNYWLVLADDVTEQKRAEKEILNSLIEGEERERKRIAKELHDGLGQYLSASNMNFEAVKNSLDELSDKKREKFYTGLNLLQHAIDETRTIAHNLMPTAIEDYGLKLAIQALIDHLDRASDINFSFAYDLSGSALNQQAQINLYRVIQEALSNAIKYADCTKVSVQLYKHEQIISCMIEDNGIGATIDATAESQGMGIRSMKTRVNALSGTIEFNSKPSSGMTILIELPTAPNTEK